MRILHVTKKYPKALGGDATCVSNLERQQKLRGDEVFILTTNCAEIFTKDNVFKFGMAGISSDWDSVSLRRVISLTMFFFRSLFIILRIRPEVIHSHSAELGFLVSFWARLFRIPSLITCHTITFVHRFLTPFKRYPEWFCLKFGWFDRICAADANSERLLKESGFKNVSLLPVVAVDPAEFSPAGSGTGFSRSQDKKFLFVGRLDRLKGIEVLLQAVSALAKVSPRDFSVWIAGEGPDKKRLEKYAGMLGLGSRVRFLGGITVRPELIDIYRQADFFVLPSLVECFPAVIVEAWASGLPVIATSVGGIPSICRNEENALLVPPQDAGALSGAMRRLLEDPGLSGRLKDNGRKSLLDGFTWNTVAMKTEQIYNELAARRRAQGGACK